MPGLTRWCVPVVVAALGALAVVAVFHMQVRGADYDPQYMRVLVERTIRFGGSYYENGIHNKGPLEPAVYELAGRLGGRAGFWFVIAVLTLATACVIGVAAAIATERCGGPRIVGVTMAVVAVVHLTLSDSDYAGVLYSRNMTVGLLAGAFAIAAWDPAWQSDRRRVAAVLAVGLAVGLAVQTLLSAGFSAAPVLAWVMWTRRGARVWSRPVWVVLPGVAAAVVVAAPMYYRAFGPWDAYVDGWWTYARWMNTATGRSLGGQFGLGVDQFVDYYGDRPLVLLVIVALLADTAVRWRRLDPAERALRSMLAVWWLGAWIELALGQRYSSHYFSILAVPTLLMLAVLVGSATRNVRLERIDLELLAIVPLAAALVTLEVGGTAGFRQGFREASAFTGVDDFETHREELVDGRTRMIRAALDLVSEPEDPLLMWTSYPWPYINLHRVSASRYIWKTFLLGEIYLARSGPEYVLPGTWETFADDVRRTDPTAFVVEAVNPVAPGTPFASLVDEQFATMFSDDVATLALRDDLAAWLRSPPGSGPVAGGTVELTPGASAPLAASGCARFDIDVVSAPGEQATVVFGFGTGEAVAPAISFTRTIEGTAVVTSSGPVGAPFTVTAGLDGVAEPDPGTDVATALTLVVGARSAVLLVDGDIAGAVNVDAGDPIDVWAPAAATRLEGLTRSDPPPGSGC